MISSNIQWPEHENDSVQCSKRDNYLSLTLDSWGLKKVEFDNYIASAVRRGLKEVCDVAVEGNKTPNWFSPSRFEGINNIEAKQGEVP